MHLAVGQFLQKTRKRERYAWHLLADFLLTNIKRRELVVVEDEALGPIDVRLFGAVRPVLALSCDSMGDA